MSEKIFAELEKCYAYLYVNKSTGEEKVSLKPWKRDGTEKWPKTWAEYELVVKVDHER